MSSEAIQESTNAGNALFPLGQSSQVYRSSVAYILQHIKSFITAIQSLRNRELTQLENQALQRFNGVASHFSGVLSHLGKKWVSAVLNWPSTHLHNYIDSFRKTLCDICKQLSLDPDKIIAYDSIQDGVNKAADLKHLRQALRDVRDSAISCPNSVDLQQLIETRLESINQRVPSTSNRRRTSSAIPGSESIPVADLKERIDRELSVFASINIPCEDLRCDDSLGTGGFGTVFRAIRLSTAEILAVKEVRTDKLTMQTWASLYSEVATMASLKHPFVLELVGAHVKEPYRIITRFCPGKSLFDRLHRSGIGRISPERLTVIAYQIAEGMKFLHANGIVHRDLKTMNILLDDNGVAKIADFGLAGMIRDGKDLVGGVGTPHYTAPEVLERKRYGPKVDTYSYGMILWEMATGQIPFRDRTHQEIYDAVVNRNDRMPFTDNVPVDLRRLISKCWAQHPNNRPDFTEIVEMFQSGKIKFNGCVNPVEFIAEPKEMCPPLDIVYLKSVLKDPSDSKFPSIVKFLTSHIDKRVREILRKENLIDKYTENDDHIDSILLVASELLAGNEFYEFIEEKGRAMIEKIVSGGEKEALISVVKFCLKVPCEFAEVIDDYVPKLVQYIAEEDVGQYVVQLLARLPVSTQEMYRPEIVKFFNASNSLSNVRSQADLDAISALLALFGDEIEDEQWMSFIVLLERELDVPLPLITWLIEKTAKTSMTRLVYAIVTAALKTDVTAPLVKVLKTCTMEDLEDIAKKPDIFVMVQRLIEEKRLIDVALLIVFYLARVPSVPIVLANHPLLQAILQIEGHVAQRLQIFACLFMSEEFCSDTTSSEGALKLLVSSLSVESLTTYALKLIGALSSHPSGCSLIAETGMLSLFSQIFLSSSCSDTQTSLTILSNCAKGGLEIPQISLIVSCLMQDLLYSVTNKAEILTTLYDLITLSADCVQEHDLQNSILPLLSPRYDPVIVTLVLKILGICDATKFRGFYQRLAKRIYTIISTDAMLYPELITAALEVIACMTIAYDMKTYIQKINLCEFLTHTVSHIATDFPDLSQKLDSIRYAFDSREVPLSPLTFVS